MLTCFKASQWPMLHSETDETDFDGHVQQAHAASSRA